MAFLDIFSKKRTKDEKIKIVVDKREKNSLVPSFLEEQGFQVEWKQLPVADYLVRGVAIERKTISDLKGSIINKRLFRQLSELKQYPSHFLLVEGILDDDLYNSGIHQNAFRGFLLSVILEYRTPIVFTYDEEDTAKYISVLAKKKDKVEQGIRASKIFLLKREQVQFILEGFPNVGASKANKLINKFGSLKNVFNASEEELGEILGKRAKDFLELVNGKV